MPMSISESESFFQVADELVAEFTDPGNNIASPDQVCSSFDMSILDSLISAA